ncbi:MAG: amidohydrolase, partial [Sediminibacterium sp.]|nr:amidohydrolase [Sediminibacterium sp.]
MFTNKQPFFYLFILLIILFSCKDKPIADTVYFNAQIWTGDTNNPSATIIAIKGNKIMYIGNDEKAFNAKQKIDLQNKMIVPGFMDNHTHFLLGGYSLSNLQLKNRHSKQDFIEAIKMYCLKNKNNNWITGGDWNNENWGGEMPNKSWIDSVSGEHPICITRYDGHLVLANSKALQIAQINNQTISPKGGQISKDVQHNLTGILKDEAMNLITKKIPLPLPNELSEYLKNATEYALSNGVTQIVDMGYYNGWNELQTYLDAYKKNQLKLRIYSVIPLQDWKQLAKYVAIHGRGDDNLKWGGLKGFVDGSLGSSTAWFYQPYKDNQHTKGINITDTINIKNWVTSADSAGLQIFMHAIGDKANDFILETFNYAAIKNKTKESRHRIEHAQHLNNALVEKFKKYTVIPSMQPYHLFDDGSFAFKRLEEKRLNGMYMIKSLLENNIPICFGSDWTVAPINPLLGMYAAVTRETSDGKNKNGWISAQKISVEQALKCYTTNNAFSIFLENKTGKLKVGMYAD